MKNMVFFETKNWWKDDIYWLLKSSCFYFPLMRTMVFFGPRSWWKRLYLLITEKVLFCTFQWWEIWSFFESRSWWERLFLLITENFSVVVNIVFFQPKNGWKDDIYRLPRSYYFELFRDGKCDPFLAKKLMERWYLFGLFELSMKFQDDLGNTAFRAETTNINGLSLLLSIKSLF